MDVNLLRIGVTVLSLLAFVGIMGWVALRRHRPGFDEAAALPFADESREAQP